jgi:suppressor for copper-sensitivity B
VLPGNVTNFICFALRAAAVVILLQVATTASAATSEIQTTPAADISLITAENAIARSASSLSAGLAISLSDGWKTYWRSPGEVGLPPELDFAGSENVAEVEMLWPAPHRFTAFGIQNFGYDGEVVLPLRIRLERPGEPAVLRATASLLVCSDVCVPLEMDFSLDVPAGSAAEAPQIDRASAERIAAFAAQVPSQTASEEFAEISAFMDAEARTLTIEARGTHVYDNPDVFPEMGEYTAFGLPDIRLGDGGTVLWAQLPILALDEEAVDAVITLTDGDRAVTLAATPLDRAPNPPFAIAAMRVELSTLLWIALLAFGGGMILNVMPCVLPVLSIKLASVVSGNGKPRAQIRAGFFASALGVMAFMWALAAITFGLQQIGVTVGWGLQFQNPMFLALMIVILAVFAANMIGLFEISLPSRWQTRLAASGSRGGFAGDFATGAFAAVLATPCSAPFLGTAIAFALTGGAPVIALVFTALGLGLSTPYLAIAIYPRMAQAVPKPGRWMIVLKVVLSLLLLLTAAWLVWVLLGVAGQTAVIATIALTALLIGAIALKRLPDVPRWAGIAVLAVAAVVSAGQFADLSSGSASATATEWAVFDRSAIAQHVSRGEVVFVDVTADWCLTCQANKVLVLDRDPVVGALTAEGVIAMRADWTRPDEGISRFLASFDRYGIPFNAVYGPGAPDGIVLSELLSIEAVMEALSQAAAREVAVDN